MLDAIWKTGGVIAGITLFTLFFCGAAFAQLPPQHPTPRQVPGRRLPPLRPITGPAPQISIITPTDADGVPYVYFGRKMDIRGSNFVGAISDIYVVISTVVEPAPPNGPDSSLVEFNPESASVNALEATVPNVSAGSGKYYVWVATLSGGWSNPVVVRFGVPPGIAPYGYWGWSKLPTYTLTNLAVASRAYNGKLYVFASRTQDNRIYFTMASGYLPGSWTDWMEVPGGIQSDTTLAASARINKLHLFAKGSDSFVYMNALDLNRAWKGWTRVPGGHLTGVGLCAATFNNNIYLFSVGDANRIYFNIYDDAGWKSSWSEVVGLHTNVALGCATAGDELFLFAKSADDNRIYSNKFKDLRWEGWGVVPGNLLTNVAPSAISIGAATVYLFATDTQGGTIYVNHRAGPQWSGWSEVPGGIRTDTGVGVSFGNNTNMLFLLATGSGGYVYFNSFTAF